MSKPSKLSKRRQDLALEYRSLVGTLAGYFLQHRPAWQRSNLRDDLEGEGFLALCKAARTYDPKRLPYPKAYFARAILNGMYKWIKRGNREPAGERVSMEVAQDRVGSVDEMDHLAHAIDMLAPEHQSFASDRFEEGMTLRTLSEEHGIPLKRTSQRARRIAAQLAELLDIQLPEPKRDH
jgi:RNA polymerase sigma factor (sigma-70 family)